MQNVSLDRGGFTLFELIIVVVLIGALYGIFINKLEPKKPKDRADSITLETIKPFLKSLKSTKLREIVCTTPCTECTVFVDSVDQKMELELFEQMPIVYTIDRYNSTVQKEYLSIFDQKGVMREVCFRFKLFENGSSSHMIVKKGEDSFAVFRSMSRVALKASSLSEAQELLRDDSILPLEKRDYDF